MSADRRPGRAKGGAAGGGLPGYSPHLHVPNELRQPQAQERERRSFAYLLRVIREADMRAVVAVHNGCSAVERGLLNSHFCH